METQTNTSVAFLDDDEKLLDFDRVSKKSFLEAYSYLTEEEYDATKNELKKLDKSATQVVVDRRIQKGMDVLERTGANISKLDFDGKEKLLNETMSELEKRWEKKKDLCVSRYGILFEINYEQLADLIKARDAFKAERKLEQAPLEYSRPNAKALEWGFDDGWHFKEVVNGYAEFRYSSREPMRVNRLDIMDVFESDEDAAKQYAIDNGVEILRQGRDIFPDTDSNEKLEYGEFPATEENKKWFAKNGLLLNQPLEFKWDKFTEKQFEELYEEIKNKNATEGLKGSIELGGLSIELTRTTDKWNDEINCEIYQLGVEKAYGKLFGIPYGNPVTFTVPFNVATDVNYGGFKHRLEKKIIDEIAPYKELRIAASQKTVDWDNEKAVKGYWSERLGERLADSFATLDFKPQEWSELLNKGADAREAIKTAAEDANLGDNLNWLLDNVPQEKLNEYFSDKQYCEDVFEVAKDSFIRSGFGDKYEASDIYTDAFIKLSELADKEKEMREFGEQLMIDAGIAVKVFPYDKDSQSVEAVRDFLGEINGYSSNQVGNEEVRAFIDNIGRPVDDGNYIIVGRKDNLGYIEWHDNERPETITYLPGILAEIESWADYHRTGQDEDSEQYLDYNYIKQLKQKVEKTNAVRIEKVFDGIQSELGSGSAQTFAEMHEWIKENFPGWFDRVKIINVASRMIEGAADFGELSAEEFDARYGNGEASEKRMDIADFAANRVLTGKLSSWKEIQSFVSRESEKFMKETKAELEKEILSEIKEKWTFGDATVPDAVKIYNPKDFGLEDNGKLHVLLQFHIADSNEFGSAMPEDGLFNLINSDWQDDKFGGLEIDFNPIDVAKSGTIEEYLANMKSHYEKELAEEKNSDIHKTIAETVEKSVDEVFKEKFPLASNEGREVAVPLEQAHLETAEEIESFMAKEAEEYVANKSDKGNFDVEKFGAAFFSESSMRIAFRDAATFGYNMAKNNITELQEKYDKLLSEHEKLQADYDKLLDNFNNLSSGRAKHQKNSGMGY